MNLARVTVSLTTLDPELKRTLEPRAASPQARLRVISALARAGVPVSVLAAPMIPAVNDAELEQLMAAAAEAGATRAGYVLLRLPHEVKELFRAWLRATPAAARRARHVAGTAGARWTRQRSALWLAHARHRALGRDVARAL